MTAGRRPRGALTPSPSGSCRTGLCLQRCALARSVGTRTIEPCAERLSLARSPASKASTGTLRELGITHSCTQSLRLSKHADRRLRRLHEGGEDCRFAARAFFGYLRAIFASGLDALRPLATTATTTRTEGTRSTSLPVNRFQTRTRWSRTHRQFGTVSQPRFRPPVQHLPIAGAERNLERAGWPARPRGATEMKG